MVKYGKKIQMKKILSNMISVLAGVMELAAAFVYMTFSLVFIQYGYEDYMMNRSRMVLTGCFLAVIFTQFLVGETLLHIYTAIRWRIFLFKGCEWFLETGIAIGLVSRYDMISAFLESRGLDGDALIYIEVVVFCLLLMYLSMYPFLLCSDHGKKGILLFLILLAWEILWLLTENDIVFGNKDVNKPLIVTFLVWLTASFLAGVLRLLAVDRRKKKGETKKWQVRLKRAVPVLLAGIILMCFAMYAPDELLEILPRQDEEGYYLLCTREGFEWFVDRINQKNEPNNVNVRLTADIVLNDTSNWENWEKEPPEHQYRCMVYYSGHFDGNGHTLEGYYSEWNMPIFNNLEEQALVADLKIRKSLFQTIYEDSSYDVDGKINVVPAAALCLSNDGKIERCDVEAKVLGAWESGGIVSVNYNIVKDCCFSGTVEGGRYFCEDRGDDRWAVETLCVGGICKINLGEIQNCINEGTVLANTVTDTYHMHYDVGGITGSVKDTGSVENCKNLGTVTSPQSAGGIAGINHGEISRCANIGEVHVEQDKLGYVTSLITAGICALNGGMVDSCWNTGEVSVSQYSLSCFAPVYGIACNLVTHERGQTRNCYYLSDNARQDYRQLGVYKLAEAEMADVGNYIEAGLKYAGGQADISDSYVISDVDSRELFTEMPDYPGTDEEDYIHLHMGPGQDTEYEVRPGDTLWGIAESFYGDGIFYSSLVRQREDLEENSAVASSENSSGILSGSDLIFSGEKILVPGLDYYLLCANEEEGFGWAFCQDVSGEPCPTAYFMAKPEDWYYGSMNFAANRGLEALWPKDKESGHGAAAGDIRILYYIDGNPEGDFLAGKWESAKEKIAESAEIYCGRGIERLRFYRYELDNGEALYGYSFRLYPGQCPYESVLRRGENAQVSGQEEALNCAVFFRLREGLIAEFIGIEPVSEDMDVLARTRYLAARVAEGPALEEEEYTGEEFYGREDWPYTKLHNPFAVALEYSPEKECDPYVLVTGTQ